MPGNKEHQEICVVGRLFSLEALIVIMGVVSLIYGLVTSRINNVITGVIVLAAAFLVLRIWRRMQAK